MNIATKSIHSLLKFPSNFRSFQQIQYFAVDNRMSAPKIFEKSIEFQTINGKMVKIQAIYEDSLSVGSDLGTVIAFHGSPGSHNDFKYIREKLDGMAIRFIGINYPGFKKTEGYPDQDFGNEERQRFTDKLLNELNIQGKIVCMGHSRGAENALMTAAERDSHGLVLINPIGLRPHKGISPQSRLRRTEQIYDYLPKKFGDAMMYRVYTMIGFRVVDGEEAINALRTMNRCAIEKQLEYIERLNESSTKLLILFSGNDHLVEKEVIIEALEKYKGLQHLNIDSDYSDNSTKMIMDKLSTSKGVSVLIEQDNHFQNKTRADLIASSIQNILSQPSRKNKI